MIKKLSLLIASLVIVSCSKSEMTNEPDDKTTDKEAVSQQNDVLLDVRTAEEFAAGHLKNAINIPHDEISDKISDHVTDKNAKIVVYCKSGGRAAKAKGKLDKLGFKDVTNAGGYDDLKSDHETETGN